MHFDLGSDLITERTYDGRLDLSATLFGGLSQQKKRRVAGEAHCDMGDGAMELWSDRDAISIPGASQGDVRLNAVELKR